MHRFLFLAAPLVAVIFLTGCTSLRGKNEPVIEDYMSAGWPVGWSREIGTMASDASRRLTVVRLKSENAEWKVGEFCSEPPPDAVVAIREQLTAELKGLDDKEAKLASLIASSMGPLMHRSQGLQWHRDNMAYICMAYMNRLIKVEDYKALMEQSMLSSKELIAEEIKKGSPPITINIGNLPAPAGESQSD